MSDVQKTSIASRPAWVYAVAAALVLAIAGGAWYISRGREDAKNADLAALDAGTQAQGGEGGASGGSTEPSALTTQAPGTTAESDDDSPAKPGSSTPADSDDDPTPERPTEPAEEGAELTTVTVPPPSTVAMLDIPEGFETARFNITFRPYGPAMGPNGPSMVITIDEMDPLGGDTDEVKDLSGLNAVCSTPPSVIERVAEGGMYSGVLEVRANGDVGVLVLTQVSDKRESR